MVLITLTTIFANALMAFGVNMMDAALALTRERLSIMRGPHGEMLDEGSVPFVDQSVRCLEESFRAAWCRSTG